MSIRVVLLGASTGTGLLPFSLGILATSTLLGNIFGAASVIFGVAVEGVNGLAICTRGSSDFGTELGSMAFGKAFGATKLIELGRIEAWAARGTAVVGRFATAGCAGGGVEETE